MKQLLTILFTCCSTVLLAQYQALPSKGIGEVKIGMPVQTIIGIIGAPSDTATYEAEKMKWQHAGYATSNEIVFGISFDKVYSFTDDKRYGIWKVYTLHDSAVIINISRFTYSNAIMGHIVTSNDLQFYNDSVAVIRCLGSDYTKGSGTKNYNEFIYQQKGIAIITDENRLCNMLLFKATEMQLPAKENDPCDVLMVSNW